MKYRTIVADPPWDHSDGTGMSLANGKWVKPPSYSATPTNLPYAVMSLEQIRTLPVADLAERDAHLFLWTTNRFLEASYAVAREWGFEPVKPLIWCKTPTASFIGGAFGGASVEFCLYARKPYARINSYAGRQWFEWPRAKRMKRATGATGSTPGPHSAKPDAFLDLVEQVCPGPYVELFARRARFGWDYWGDQSLGTAEMPEVAA